MQLSSNPEGSFPSNSGSPSPLSSAPSQGSPLSSTPSQPLSPEAMYDSEAGAVTETGGLPGDTDSRPQSPHHTLGNSPHQAAPGYETHNRLRRIEQSPAVTIGAISMFAGTVISDPNWLMCNGAFLLRNQYPELFEIIGTRYNTPSVPSTFFALPNLAARFPLGTSSLTGVGTQGGATFFTLNELNLPSHSHSVAAHSHSISSHSHTVSPHDHGFSFRYLSTTQTGSTAIRVNDLQDSTGGVGTRVNTFTNQNSTQTTSSAGGGTTGVGGPSSTGVAGNGSPVNHMPPYLTINFVIRAR